MLKTLVDSPEARLQDLRQQHEQWARAGYDGHNRHPLRTTMRRLRKRHTRRRAHQSLHSLAREWSLPRMYQVWEVA